MKVTVSNYTPLNRRILVLPPPPEEKTTGGVYIPQQSQVRPNNGEVISIDPLVSSVKLGQRVLYHQGIGLKICINQVDYLLLHENEILMTYEQSEVTS